jgi:hypothetical protein
MFSTWIRDAPETTLRESSPMSFTDTTLEPYYEDPLISLYGQR